MFDRLDLRLAFQATNPRGPAHKMFTWADLRDTVEGLQAFFPLRDPEFGSPQYFQAQFQIQSKRWGRPTRVAKGLFRKLGTEGVENDF